VGRSNAYWAGNRYADEAVEPVATAPLKDLPAKAAERFGALRDGLRKLDGVAESVRYMGATWRWSWEYGIGSRKLCWVHVIGNAVSVTFTLSGTEEDQLRGTPGLTAELMRAMDEAQRTGPLKWCWLELPDRREVGAFLKVAARKADWLAGRPPTHRSPRLPRRAKGSGNAREGE
jgi:Protein of unknown function (DUF3788)